MDMTEEYLNQFVGVKVYVRVPEDCQATLLGFLRRRPARFTLGQLEDKFQVVVRGSKRSSVLFLPDDVDRIVHTHIGFPVIWLKEGVT